MEEEFARLTPREICILCLGGLIVGVIAVVFSTLVANIGCLADISGCQKLPPWRQFITPGLLSDAIEEQLKRANILAHRGVYFLLVTPVVGIFIYIFIEKVVRDEETKRQLRGGGTRQSLLATARGTVISWHTLLSRMFLSSIYLGIGAGSLGAESPIIHISTALFTSLASCTRRHVPQSIKERYRVVLYASVGTASAVCAAFSCPVSGVIFAMEELQEISSKPLSRKELAVVSLTSVLASLVSKCIPSRTNVHRPWEIRHHVEVHWKYMLEFDPVSLIADFACAAAIGVYRSSTGRSLCATAVYSE